MSPTESMLLGALIGLARALESDEAMPAPDAPKIMVETLTRMHTADEATAKLLAQRIRQEKLHLLPDCAACPHPCGRTDDYDTAKLSEDGSEVENLKLELLSRLQKIAGQQEVPSSETVKLLQDGLNQIGWGYRTETLKKALQNYPV